MNKEKKSGFAVSVGQFLANMQLLADDLIIFIFKKIKTKSENTKVSKPAKTMAEKGIVFLAKIGKFLGDTGTSFYEHYENEKAKKNKK